MNRMEMAERIYLEEPEPKVYLETCVYCGWEIYEKEMYWADGYMHVECYEKWKEEEYDEI